jgi:hypothetical protein
MTGAPAMTTQELADRAAIADLLAAYCHAIDLHRWDDLDAVFLPDSVIDYTVFGGPRGRYAPEIKAFLAAALPPFVYAQHIVSTSVVQLDGDRATGRTVCTNPMGQRLPDGGVRHVLNALWYVDVFVRTPEGWRIAERTEEISHSIEVPGVILLSGGR